MFRKISDYVKSEMLGKSLVLFCCVRKGCGEVLLNQNEYLNILSFPNCFYIATGEDYKLLENMNIVTKERYGEMAIMAQELMQEVGKLRTTCKTPVLDSFDFHGPASFFSQLAMYNVLSYLDSDFEPYLARIDEISQQADIISNVASELDEYTKALGK